MSLESQCDWQHYVSMSERPVSWTRICVLSPSYIWNFFGWSNNDFTFSFWFCNQHLRIFAQKVDIQVLKIRNDKFWPKILVKIILKGKKFKLTKNLRKYFWQTSGWSWNLVSCHFCVRSLQKLFDRHIFGKYFSLCGFSTYWRSLTVPKKCCKCKVNLSIGVKLAYFLAN